MPSSTIIVAAERRKSCDVKAAIGTLGVSCIWRLLNFAVWPGRKPFGGAENSSIGFICELKKQVRRGLVLLGEGTFVTDLLKQKHVLVVHGSGFGEKTGTRHMRIVFLPQEDVLHAAYGKITDFMGERYK